MDQRSKKLSTFSFFGLILRNFMSCVICNDIKTEHTGTGEYDRSVHE